MRLLAVECCALEGLGSYEPALRARGVEIERFVAYDPTSTPPTPSDFDAMWVGGTPLSVSEVVADPGLLRVFELLLVAGDVPCLAVCCGAQLLAHARGGRVYRNSVMEIGMHELTLTGAGARDPITAGFPGRFPAFQWHGFGFSPPPGAPTLVTGAVGPEQMFRAGNAVGLLFHLEVTPEVAGEWAAAYADEAAAIGLAAETIVAECRRHAGEMAALADRLIDNFVSWARANTGGNGETP